MRASRGFTLVEIVTALLIVGIVTAAVIPALVFSATSGDRLSDREAALAACRTMADAAIVMEGAAEIPEDELASRLGARLHPWGDGSIYSGAGAHIAATDVETAIGAGRETVGRRIRVVYVYGDGKHAEIELFRAVAPPEPPEDTLPGDGA